jgi:hypothetical protein
MQDFGVAAALFAHQIASPAGRMKKAAQDAVNDEDEGQRPNRPYPSGLKISTSRPAASLSS